MVTLRIIYKQRLILRLKIDENEAEQKAKERPIFIKRKHLDGERAIEIDEERALVNCRNEIDEEEEHKERAIEKKRKQLDGERAIVEKRKLLYGERAIEIDEEIAKRRNEIDEEEQNMKERVIGKLGKRISYDDPLPTLSKDLPEDLIEGILKRLPARELINCSCMSKFWYNSVFNNPRFATSHFVHNQNKLSLFFDLYNVCVDNSKKVFYFRVEEDSDIQDVTCMTSLNLQGTIHTVGYCNGLTCIKGVTTDPRHKLGVLVVINPIRGEQFGLHYVPPTGCIYLCSGFGFDPLAQEYKAVVIFTSETKDEFICMVFTFGTNSWRTITTTTAEISPPPGSPPFPNQMLTRVLTRTPTLCGGDLFWRVTNKVHDDSRSEMLLLFDLHSEKIQFIRFPTECTLTSPHATTTTTNEHQYLVVDHLLEFKGYPCIARSEKIMISNSDHSGHRCVYQSSFCCCCCKVHLYILKDKVKQVWIKGETFDVQIKDQEGLLPGPLCCYFGTTTTTATTPPTHVLTFSDQVILSWFNGESLIFYNLRKKLLEVVRVSRSYSDFFRTKMNLSGRCIGDNNIYPPEMDYQLRSQVENMVSMKTFIPKGAETSIHNCYDDWRRAIEENHRLGYVMQGRNSVTIYTFG